MKTLSTNFVRKLSAVNTNLRELKIRFLSLIVNAILVFMFLILFKYNLIRSRSYSLYWFLNIFRL